MTVLNPTEVLRATSQTVLAFGQIDKERRYQLACHHTATHLIHCAAHTVLGPHVWQASAKKTVVQAHLDITHFAALKEDTHEEGGCGEAARLLSLPGRRYPLPRRACCVDAQASSKDETSERPSRSLPLCLPDCPRCTRGRCSGGGRQGVLWIASE
ncbi:hypothetical protein BLNAU_2054 [Blattamonas nauphoetae]|uniref:Uncharacterized protein n=1 Tax=Blattamonas nauphoetae TaxID=2049346 RepID=A0ABQ9YGZ5_9EUKA|nr:hypothetical protein BLNAU_2054 [Blattamonas nauphoetae]